MAENRRRAAELCAGFSAVAAGVEHAATRRAMSPGEITEVSPTNQMVSWPYTKAMVANNTVDRAGALLVCSLAVAREHAIAQDRMVFPHRIALADDAEFVASRRELATHPGLQAAADDILAVTGDSANIGHMDLYACFPSMVALSMDALGVVDRRPLTVSGGLGFAGAPVNFGAGEGLIAMVDRLREDAPDCTGLVQGSGGMASKHALGLLSSSPPTSPYLTSRRTPALHPRDLAPRRSGAARGPHPPAQDLRRPPPAHTPGRLTRASTRGLTVRAVGGPRRTGGVGADAVSPVAAAHRWIVCLY